jgi:predicted transcriptional regulator
MTREREVLEGIRRGLADVEAGRVVSHEEAMAQLDAAIEAASQRRRVDHPEPRQPSRRR